MNIVTANKVIIYGPWWKVELEQQAIKRTHRPGQTRAVEVVKLKADSDMDQYRARVRDKKHKHNSKIVEAIIREDGVIPQSWDNFE